MRVALFLSYARSSLKHVSLDASWLARELVSRCLDIPPLELPSHYSRTLSDTELIALHRHLRDLHAFVPLEYTLGYAYFDGLRIKSNSSALIPRPETEELVELLYDAIELRLNEEVTSGVSRGCKPLNILELGCGSGCAIAALGARLKRWGLLDHVALYASDIDTSCLQLTRTNLRLVDLEAGVTLRQGSWWQPWKGLEFDFVLCNPPYIAKDEVNVMSTQTWLWEPHRALFDRSISSRGLSEYMDLLSQMCHHVRGALYFELGYRQSELMREEDLVEKWIPLFSQFGISYEFKYDMSGTERFLIVNRGAQGPC